jgi:GGDEF domain-containing protein
MEAAVRRPRASFARERRRARQMAGVEAVGRLLATDPSPDSTFAAASIDAPSGKLTATASAGCSAIGPSMAPVSTLLEVADVALQMAKRGGHNQVVAA